jgi:hypothetical protein
METLCGYSEAAMSLSDTCRSNCADRRRRQIWKPLRAGRDAQISGAEALVSSTIKFHLVSNRDAAPENVNAGSSPNNPKTALFTAPIPTKSAAPSCCFRRTPDRAADFEKNQHPDEQTRGSTEKHKTLSS